MVPCQCLRLRKNIAPLTFRPKHLQTSASKGCLVNGMFLSWNSLFLGSGEDGPSGSRLREFPECCRMLLLGAPKQRPWGRRENGLGQVEDSQTAIREPWHDCHCFFCPPTEQYYSWLVVWNMNFTVHNLWDNPSH